MEDRSPLTYCYGYVLLKDYLDCSLLSVGASSFGGGSGAEDFGSAQNLILGTVTLVCCILFNIFAKSYWKQLSVLFGLVVGYLVAICMGRVDFSAVISAGVISFPQVLPVVPKSHLGAIVSVLVLYPVLLDASLSHHLVNWVSHDLLGLGTVLRLKFHVMPTILHSICRVRNKGFCHRVSR